MLWGNVMATCQRLPEKTELGSFWRCAAVRRETVVVKCSWDLHTRCGEKVSTVRAVEHWSRLPREVVQSAGPASIQLLSTAEKNARSSSRSPLPLYVRMNVLK